MDTLKHPNPSSQFRRRPPHHGSRNGLCRHLVWFTLLPMALPLLPTWLVIPVAALPLLMGLWQLHRLELQRAARHQQPACGKMTFSP